jgi:MerR HTH family regulatory protein
MVIAMPNRALKLKQASAVLGVPPKDLQNFVQSGVLRPRRVGALYYFDRKALVSAKVALYLKDSLGASTRYLTQFTRAVSKVPGFATGEAEAVRVQSGARNEQPVSILIPLRGLVADLDERLPLAERARDLPRGRKRAGWKEELRAAIQQGATDLGGVSQADIAKTIKSYRRERRKPELTVVAEAVEATA